jgi:hypothetical protein
LSKSKGYSDDLYRPLLTRPPAASALLALCGRAGWAGAAVNAVAAAAAASS